MIDEELFTLATADGDLENIIDTNFFPVSVPQNIDLPAITYYCLTQSKVHSHDGAGSLVIAEYQFDLYATSHPSLKLLRKAFLDVFDGLCGVGSIGSMLSTAERDLTGPPMRGSQEHVFRWSIDMRIVYDEAT